MFLQFDIVERGFGESKIKRRVIKNWESNTSLSSDTNDEASPAL